MNARACQRCGAQLTESISRGLCPSCLLWEGLSGTGDQKLAGGGQEAEGQSGEAASGIANRSPEIPNDFGDYELLEEIGRGGMGVVYKARQKSLDRVVALKMLLFEPQAGSEIVQRFQAEAAAAASLQHPNIVAIHEVGVHEGQHFFAMDYVPGLSLAQLAGHQPLPARRAAGYLKTIAEAVHDAHEHGILHRDLKPSNVLIDAQDQPRVMDFGLAKRFEGASQVTLTGQVLGSPSYIPPEQALGRRGKVSRQTDVYALGAMLYHLLTGRPPFQGETMTETLQLLLNTEPPAPRLLNPRVPRDLETICLKCLEKEIPRRYSTAQKLAEELGRFLDGKPIRARPVGAVGRVWKWCRRKPERAVLIAALVAVVALGSGGVLWQWRKAEQARRDAVEKLWQSLLAQAQANRWSARAGRRFAGLEAIRQAAAIRPTLELRNEAIACLALPDARVQSQLLLDPGAAITGLAFDANLERYACAYEDSSVSIRRTENNSELFKLPARGPIAVCKLLFSPQGRFLAQGANEGASAPSAVWDLSRRSLVFTFPFVVRSMCFTPDDQQLALAEPQGRVHFHDLSTGTETGSITVAPDINHLVFDPAGRRLAVSRDQSPSVLILDLKAQSVCASLTNAGGVGRLAWAPDGNLLACPSSDGRVYLWNVATGERKALEGHTGVVPSAIFNRLGDVVVSSGWDGVTWFWDPKLGLPLVNLPGGWHQNGFDLTDRLLGFYVDAHHNGIWEVDPARECRRLGRTAAVWSGDFTLDGRVLATASSDGVRLWQVPLNRLLAHLPVNEARSVIWHPNGADLITSGALGAQLWPVEFSRDATEARIGPARHLSPLGSEQGYLTADGHLLAVADGGNADLVTFDLDHPSQPRLLNGHARTHFVSISPDGKWFATGTWHGTAVKVWSTKTWQPVKELAVKGSARCAFSPDGQWLLTGSPEEYSLWQVDSWAPGLKIPRDQAGDMYGAMAFSPDGRMAALLQGRNGGVKLVSIPDGRDLAALDTGEPLCFSRDGGQLATAGEDHRTLVVWELRLIRNQLRAMKLDWDTGGAGQPASLP